MDPLVEEHWPQLAALHRALAALPSQVNVAATTHAAPANEDELLAKLLAKLNRPGGPKISSRAIV